MKKEKRNGIRIAVIILAVLVVLSLLALVGVILFRHASDRTGTTVSVPDNLITTEDEKTDRTTDRTDLPSTDTNASEEKKALTICLYNRKAQDNLPFEVGNLFPGDRVTQYYHLQVSYRDRVTVHCKATVRDGSEKLAEVLKVKVSLVTTGEILYDGSMNSFSEGVSRLLSSEEQTTDELYYEVTAYLDTSVGNEYQNAECIADLTWWVEEANNLDKPPHTEDRSVLLWGTGIAVSLFGLTAFAVKRKKEGENRG